MQFVYLFFTEMPQTECKNATRQVSHLIICTKNKEYGELERV